MLLLITYDVNTETPAGKKTVTEGSQRVRQLWTESAKLCL